MTATGDRKDIFLTHVTDADKLEIGVESFTYMMIKVTNGADVQEHVQEIVARVICYLTHF
jgi:hypothetical protein